VGVVEKEPHDLMNCADHMAEWERPASCRDKGRGGVDEGALCLSSWRLPHLAGDPEHLTEAWGDQDKHKAPTHPHVRPLSLQVRQRFPPVPGGRTGQSGHNMLSCRCKLK